MIILKKWFIVGVTIWVILAVACSVAWSASITITTPINLITQSMTQLSNGDTDLSVPLNIGSIELRKLADAMVIFQNNITRRLEMEETLRVTIEDLPDDAEDSEYIGLILGNGDRLQQVFRNILENGVNFTPENGDIGMDMLPAERIVKQHPPLNLPEPTEI